MTKPLDFGDAKTRHLVYVGKNTTVADVEARLREYQRALLWCYGLIQEEMSEANAEQIDDVRWLDIKRLVGEASEEVEP